MTLGGELVTSFYDQQAGRTAVGPLHIPARAMPQVSIQLAFCTVHEQGCVWWCVWGGEGGGGVCLPPGLLDLGASAIPDYSAAVPPRAARGRPSCAPAQGPRGPRQLDRGFADGELGGARGHGRQQRHVGLMCHVGLMQVVRVAMDASSVPPAYLPAVASQCEEEPQRIIFFLTANLTVGEAGRAAAADCCAQPRVSIAIPGLQSA